MLALSSYTAIPHFVSFCIYLLDNFPLFIELPHLFCPVLASLSQMFYSLVLFHMGDTDDNPKKRILTEEKSIFGESLCRPYDPPSSPSLLLPPSSVPNFHSFLALLWNDCVAGRLAEPVAVHRSVQDGMLWLIRNVFWRGRGLFLVVWTVAVCAHAPYFKRHFGESQRRLELLHL